LAPASAEQLEAALDSRIGIEQAKGVLAKLRHRHGRRLPSPAALHAQQQPQTWLRGSSRVRNEIDLDAILASTAGLTSAATPLPS
jgi:hypothetical protein